MLDFFVQLHRFWDGFCGRAVFFILLGGGPVNQRRGQFLPVIALGAQVAYAVAFHFIFRDQLIRAVIQDQAAGEILGRGYGGKREQEHEGRQEQSSPPQARREFL